MKFISVATVLTSLAASALASPLVGRQESCPEAARFGDFTITPSTLAPGDVCLSYFPSLHSRFPFLEFYDHCYLQLFFIFQYSPSVCRLSPRNT